VEARLWPNGAVCSHCGETKRVGKMGGKATRIGAHKCYACRKQFTVKIGTVFESSHVPLHQWLQAFYLICGSKKAISSNQLHRILGVTLKTAWFISHRIREAMRGGAAVTFGSDGGAVEADETFIGREPGEKGQKAAHARGFRHKIKVLSLVDRESGQVRSFAVDHVGPATRLPIVRENVAKEARLMSDESRWYYPIGREFAEHKSVFHSRGE
jgi:transposase-like protein